MIWLKLWTDARKDPKLRSLSDREFRIWFDLLCVAAEQPTEGTIIDDWVAIAELVTDGDVPMLQAACNALQQRRLIRYREAGKGKALSGKALDDSGNALQADSGNALHDSGNALHDSGNALHPSGNALPVKIFFPSFRKRQSRKASDSRERVAERVRKYRAARKLRQLSVPKISDPHQGSGNLDGNALHVGNTSAEACNALPGCNALHSSHYKDSLREDDDDDDKEKNLSSSSSSCAKSARGRGHAFRPEAGIDAECLRIAGGRWGDAFARGMLPRLAGKASALELLEAVRKVAAMRRSIKDPEAYLVKVLEDFRANGLPPRAAPPEKRPATIPYYQEPKDDRRSSVRV